MDTQSVQSFIAGQVAAVERSIAGGTGGAALCQLQKSGRMTGGLKYGEGQLCALLAAQRLVRSREVSDLHAALEALATDWSRQLSVYLRQEHPPEQWVAYYQGGVDALVGVREVAPAV